jgi:hypothetical protein
MKSNKRKGKGTEGGKKPRKETETKTEQEKKLK